MASPPASGPDPTNRNVRGYVPYDQALFGAERRVLPGLVRPGTVLADIGCGTGRVGRRALSAGARVVALDLNRDALSALRAAVPADARLLVACTDARALPLADGSVDVAVAAYNVFDFIVPEGGRDRALREAARVLRPGGHLVFSSHSLLGEAFSPRGLRSPRGLLHRLRYLARGDLRRRYYRDPGGVLLFHESTGRTVERVVRLTGLRLVDALGTRSGLRLPRPLLGLLSAWPTYVFVKPGRPAG